jgi:hypothetical protein
MIRKVGLTLVKVKVPDGDHLMRYVPYGQQIRDPDDESFKGIVGTAFSVRPSDKGGLSVTWIEHYGPKSLATYSKAASKFRDSQGSKKLGAKAYFAIGEAGAARKMSATYGKKIRLVHAPDGPNTGHVELRRFTDEDRRLLDALALDVFAEHVAVTNLTLLPSV